MSTSCIPTDRNTIYLLPPSIQDWLPKDHLARFIADIVSQLNLRAITDQYGVVEGSKAYHPRMLLALLFYGYATGVFSSRKIEQATYDYGGGHRSGSPPQHNPGVESTELPPGTIQKGKKYR